MGSFFSTNKKVSPTKPRKPIADIKKNLIKYTTSGAEKVFAIPWRSSYAPLPQVLRKSKRSNWLSRIDYLNNAYKQMQEAGYDIYDKNVIGRFTTDNFGYGKRRSKKQRKCKRQMVKQKTKCINKR